MGAYDKGESWVHQAHRVGICISARAQALCMHARAAGWLTTCIHMNHGTPNLWTFREPRQLITLKNKKTGGVVTPVKSSQSRLFLAWPPPSTVCCP